MCVNASALEEPEDQVDALELIEPALHLNAFAPADEIGSNLIETVDHDRALENVGDPTALAMEFYQAGQRRL